MPTQLMRDASLDTRSGSDATPEPMCRTIPKPAHPPQAEPEPCCEQPGAHLLPSEFCTAKTSQHQAACHSLAPLMAICILGTKGAGCMLQLHSHDCAQQKAG